MVHIMNKLLTLGNRYAQESTWKDFALLKFCLFSMGLLAGMHVPEKHKKNAAKAAIFAFSATYVPLMAKVLRIATEKTDEQK